METPYAELADLLGIAEAGSTTPGPIQIMDRIQQGLPLGVLYDISGQVAPDDKAFVFRIVPKASLARRKHGAKRLTADQSNRLARLASVWALAETVWQGPNEARDFLFRPHPMLEARRPIDVVLGSELGADMVKDILGRLFYGTAA